MEKSAHLVKVFVSSRDDVDIVLGLQNNSNIYINIWAFAAQTKFIVLVYSGLVQDSYSRINENLRSPVELASRFGWLEILNYLNTILSPDDFHDSAMTMMTVAIRSSQTSVVRWLVDRNCCPTDEHLELAFDLERSEIIQAILEMNLLSIDTLVNG